MSFGLGMWTRTVVPSLKAGSVAAEEAEAAYKVRFFFWGALVWGFISLRVQVEHAMYIC